MSTQPSQIAGLPQGVELVRIGQAGDSDYELIGKLIYKGTRALAASGIIVKPAEGYTFRYMIKDLAYAPVKMLPKTEIVATIKFSIEDSFDLQAIDDTLAAMKSMSGFVSAERS